MATREQALHKLNQLKKQALTMDRIDTVDGSKFVYNDYREEIEAAKPSEKPEYWAKSGCRKCHGTGIEGMTTTIFGQGNQMKRSEICDCASQNWKRWQADFVAKLKEDKRREEAAKAAPPEQLPLPIANETTSSTVTQADPKQVRAMERIEGLHERIVPLHVRIIELEGKLNHLPQGTAVEVAQAALAERMREEADAVQLAEMKEQQARQLEAEAEHYRTMAREATRQAAALRQQKNSDVLPEVKAAGGRRQLAELDLERCHESLSRARHQVQKKIREVERQKARLVGRIEKIRKESGLNSAVFTAETEESVADQASPSNG